MARSGSAPAAGMKVPLTIIVVLALCVLTVKWQVATGAYHAEIDYDEQSH